MPDPVHTLLVPVDFGEVSEHALGVALDLAKRLGAAVHLVHVYQIPIYGFPDGAFLAGPEVASRIADSAKKGLEGMVERLKSHGVTLGSTLRQGNPHEEIVALAAELPAEMIVMGTHGRGVIAHALLGSVTERVVRTSPVPVLTVRHKDHGGKH